MLAFRHYDADALVEGKPMRDHLRFAVSYWHAFRGTGADPFGPGTMLRPWETAATRSKAALRVDVAFEFLEKLGCDFYCFHDRDMAPEGATLAESNKPSRRRGRRPSRRHQQRTGKRLLWGTANLFATRATCTAPRRARTPRCSPTRPPR